MVEHARGVNLYENYSVVINKYIGWMNRGQIGGLNRIKSEDWHECRYFSLLLRWLTLQST